MSLVIFELYLLHSDSNLGKFRQRFLPVNGSLEMYFLYKTFDVFPISLKNSCIN